MTTLVIDRLSHGFGRRQALRDVSFSVAPASFTVLLGPNGAGKTTLVSLVTGLYAAQQGEIAVCGHPMHTEPLKALGRLGIVLQMPTLDLDLTVAENLLYQGSLHGLPRRATRDRMQAELARMGVSDRVGDKVRVLSGGLRRRVEIARALLHRPRVLILDEASAGLDVAARRQLLASVREMCATEGLSVLWTTHLLDEVDPQDCLVVLHRGSVRWTGTAETLPLQGETLSDAFLRLTRDER